MTLSLYAMVNSNCLCHVGALRAQSMRRPLNRADVDAFLVHVPQGGQLAQLGHAFLQGGDDGVDLFFGGEAADGHAQRTVGQLIGAAQGAQHVAGLERRRGAGRARGHRDAVDAHDQRLALDVVEGDVEVVRDAALEVAVDEDLLDALQAAEQALLQRADALVLGVHLVLGDAEGLAHADDLVRGQRARTHAALVATTVHLGLQAHARLAAHVPGADALGAVGLVRGQAHQVDGQLVQVDVDLAGGLGRVHVEDDALFTTQRADGRDVLNDADLVVHVHDRDQDGVGADGGLEHVQVQQAVVLDVEGGGFEALALEFAHRVEHGLVLGLDRDDVLAARLVEMGGALQSQVVRFGGARGPDDFARVGADQLGHLGAGALDGFFRFPAVGVGARCRVAEVLAQPGDHGVHDAGVARRGGAVVHVDREERGHAHGGVTASCLANICNLRKPVYCIRLTLTPAPVANRGQAENLPLSGLQAAGARPCPAMTLTWSGPLRGRTPNSVPSP